MKKICFICFLLAALSAFCLFSCRKAGTLREAIGAACEVDEALPAGSVFCYGRAYADGVRPSLVADFLSLGEDEIPDAVEDFAVYSSLPDAEYELLLCRLYRVSDVADVRRFLEKRVSDSRRALTELGVDFAETEVFAYGNVVGLCRMPSNAAALRAVKAHL